MINSILPCLTPELIAFRVDHDLQRRPGAVWNDIVAEQNLVHCHSPRLQSCQGVRMMLMPPCPPFARACDQPCAWTTLNSMVSSFLPLDFMIGALFAASPASGRNWRSEVRCALSDGTIQQKHARPYECSVCSILIDHAGSCWYYTCYGSKYELTSRHQCTRDTPHQQQTRGLSVTIMSGHLSAVVACMNSLCLRKPNRPMQPYSD